MDTENDTSNSLTIPYKADYTRNILQSMPKRTGRTIPLPSIKAGHVTPLPGTPSFSILINSFCPNIEKATFQWRKGTSFDLTAATGLLHIEGITENENIFLQDYVANKLGVEGLKELVALVDVYKMLSSGRDQNQNIEVTAKQLLQRIKGLDLSWGHRCVFDRKILIQWRKKRFTFNETIEILKVSEIIFQKWLKDGKIIHIDFINDKPTWFLRQEILVLKKDADSDINKSTI